MVMLMSAADHEIDPGCKDTIDRNVIFTDRTAGTVHRYGSKTLIPARDA